MPTTTKYLRPFQIPLQKLLEHLYYAERKILSKFPNFSFGNIFKKSQQHFKISLILCNDSGYHCKKLLATVYLVEILLKFILEVGFIFKFCLSSEM